MKKFVVVLRDKVAENVLNIMLEDNEMTLQRNLEFAVKHFENTPVRLQDIEVLVNATLDTKTGVIECIDEDVPSATLDMFRKEISEDESTCCEV